MKQHSKQGGQQEHIGDVAWCECECHTKGTPQPFCNKCYGASPQQKESWSKKKPTEAQKKYWESMRGYKGKKANNWRGDNITIQSIHQWLNARYGRPQACEDKNCNGKSKTFDWAKKTGYDYIRDRKAFRRLCRSCHRKYDMTEKKKKQGEKNLWWNKSSYFSMKLTPEQVKAIKVELSKGVTMKKIAEQFGCHETNIWQISKGKIWKQI